MKTLLLSAMAVLSIILPGKAQDNSSELLLDPDQFTQEDYQFLQGLTQIADRYDAKRSNETTYIPIKAHFVQRNDGTGALNEGLFALELQHMNEMYAQGHIQFFLCGPVNYISSDEHYDLTISDSYQMCKDNDVEGALNVYVVNKLYYQQDMQIAGYASTPSSLADRIFISGPSVSNGSTLAHEVGHYLGLVHTHGNRQELVDGSNCDRDGDLICDTPADPNLSGKVNSNCVYNGDDLDPVGQLYHPDEANIMSYAPKSCRTIISDGQFNVMHACIATNRQYLTCSDTFHLDIPTDPTNEPITMNIYPNPSYGSQVQLSLDNIASSYFTITLYDITGTEVMQVEKENNDNHNPIALELAEMNKGIYLVQLNDGERNITQKLIYQ